MKIITHYLQTIKVESHVTQITESQCHLTVEVQTSQMYRLETLSHRKITSQ